MAEVLITLGIIGVVAAMTIPSLVAKYKNQLYVTALKKFYSEFSQVLEKNKADTGCSSAECFGFVGTLNEEWVEWAKNWSNRYFKVTDFCYGTDKCAYPVRYVNNKYTMDEGKYSVTSFPSTVFAFITADGMIIRISPSNSTGTRNVTVDINGFESPNQFGRDVHLFKLSDDGFLIPNYGYKYCVIATNKNGSCRSDLHWKTNPDLCNPKNPSSPGASYGCTARIIESGWMIDY